jgi:nucleotide-binding universal stress UspA family protein
MAKVLAAVDLTPLGRRVADRGRLLAEELDCDLELIHAVEPMGEAFVPEAVAKLVRKHATVVVDELAEWLRSRSDRTVAVSCVKGSPSWEIAKAAKKADLTLVGSSAIDHAAVGSTSRRVAEACRGDVLVVRRQPRVPYRRVVIGVDMSEASAMAVGAAFRFAPNAEYTLVHAVTSRFNSAMLESGMFKEEVAQSQSHRIDQAGLALEEFAERWPGRVRTVISEGPARDVIEETVRRRSADLVVVANHGATATKMVLLGTVAGELLAGLPCDVLIARVPGEFRRP